MYFYYLSPASGAFLTLITILFKDFFAFVSIELCGNQKFKNKCHYVWYLDESIKLIEADV
jgi:hypothetical protein